MAKIFIPTPAEVREFSAPKPQPVILRPATRTPILRPNPAARDLVRGGGGSFVCTRCGEDCDRAMLRVVQQQDVCEPCVKELRKPVEQGPTEAARQHARVAAYYKDDKDAPLTLDQEIAAGFHMRRRRR